MLSPVEQLTLHWISTERRCGVIRESPAKRLLEVNDERVVPEARSAFKRIRAFLRLDHAISLPTIEPGVLEKWRHDLTPDQTAAIDAMLSRLVFEFAGTAPPTIAAGREHLTAEVL